MQDPFGFSNNSFQRPKPKPPRKQVGLLQPKGSSQSDSAGKSVPLKVAKRPKKSLEETNYSVQYAADIYGKSTSATTSNKPAVRPVVGAANVTDGDSRSMYRALKRKYKALEEESFRLAEELDMTDREVKILEEQKHSLLDELLVLEGLAYNPYPPVQTQPRKAMKNIP